MARLGAAECLRSGVTTLVDAAYAGAAVRACTATGLRAIVAIEAFGGDDADVAAVADELDRRVEALEAEAGPRVELAVSPHAPFTVGLPLFGEIVARARARGSACVTHLGESRHELDALVRGTGVLTRFVAPFGRHPILELAERGLLGPETVVAHAVHVGDEEIAALAATGAAVAHCPRSNALLGCGVAPLARLRAAGIRVGLGTDSPSSALSLDCSTSCAPPCCSRARAPATRRRSPRPLRCRLRRSTARARSGSRTVARWRPGCSPISSPCGSTGPPSGLATTRSPRSSWAARPPW